MAVKRFTTNVTIDIADIELSVQDTFDLICALELKIADLGFTERLRDHFTQIIDADALAESAP